MGGVIAFEMARQLQRAGDTVAALALIDSYTPDAVKALERGHFRRSESADGGAETLALTAFARELGIEDPEALLLRWARVGNLAAPLDLVQEQAESASYASDDVEAARLHRLFATFQANLMAMSRYELGRYRGSVALFNAGETGESTDNGLDHGWSRAVNENYFITTVPGDHYSLLKQPNVQHLSSELKRYLDEETT